ncbi:MAG: glycosyltransferase family 39 protein [Candidatus Omnitrophica bacterium]|nr:glycosyltransferase family 39 protein [Candidatus Omnitrophota bacterium]
MNESQKEYIRAHQRSMTARQMARALGLSRPEVERWLKQPNPGSQPGTAGMALPAESSGSRALEWLLLIWVAALLVRTVFFVLLRQSPFFEPLTPTLDDGIYYGMAREIIGGNWLGAEPLSAYRVPAYPFFLAMIFVFAGVSVAAAHAVQLFVGSLGCILVYFMTRAVTGSTRAALWAAAIMAAYLPLVFYEMLLLGESISIFLNLSAMICLLMLVRREGRGMYWALPAGLLLGLSSLLRPNTLLVAVAVGGFVVIWFWTKRRSPQRAFACAFLLGAGVLATLLPMTARNYVLHKDILPVSALGGINLYIGNNPEADGKFSLVKEFGTSFNTMVESSIRIAEKASGRPLKPSEVSSYWVQKTRDYAFAQPGDLLKKAALKTAYLFNAYEFPDVLDMSFAARLIPALSPAAGMYGILVVFAALGFAGTWGPGRRAGLWLMDVFWGAYALSVVLFFVSSRYRLPIVVFLVPYAALGANRAWDLIRRRAVRGVRPAEVILVVAMTVVAFWPVEPVDFSVNYNSLAIAMKNKGKMGEAEKYYLEAIRTNPHYPSPYYNLSLLYRETGRNREAAQMRAKYEEAARAVGIRP